MDVTATVAMSLFNLDRRVEQGDFATSLWTEVELEVRDEYLRKATAVIDGLVRDMDELDIVRFDLKGKRFAITRLISSR